MDDHDVEITRFVRETLGCGCPDEVFEQIEFTPSPEGESSLDARIIIGGRLLIYIVSFDSAPASKIPLERLVREGIRERDSSGLNRFRLVIAADDPFMIKQELLRKFDSIRGDDKVHLHVIARQGETLPFLK